MKATALWAGVLSTALLGTGCISIQDYGSPGMGQRITEGARAAEVFINLGEPDTVLEGNGMTAYVYKYHRGQSYLGVYSDVSRRDLVVVIDETGTVVATQMVDVGRGRTFLSPGYPYPKTYPIPVDELLEEPENYSYEMPVGE